MARELNFADLTYTPQALELRITLERARRTLPEPQSRHGALQETGRGRGGAEGEEIGGEGEPNPTVKLNIYKSGSFSHTFA